MAAGPLEAVQAPGTPHWIHSQKSRAPFTIRSPQPACLHTVVALHPHHRLRRVSSSSQRILLARQRHRPMTTNLSPRPPLLQTKALSVIGSSL